MLTAIAFAASFGQITSPTADHMDSLAYPVKEGKDPLFVFYQTYQSFRPGTLTATLPGSAEYSFEWSRYNPDTDGFDPPFNTGNGVSSSVPDLEDGGYQVRIFDENGTDTSLTAWVLLDDLYAWVAKDSEDKLEQDRYNCERVIVSGYVSEDSLLYWDPESHLELTRALGFSFKWTSDNDDLRIPNDTIVLHPNITYAPPFKDTWYVLTVTDEYGMVEVDSVLYESIQTRAEFEVEYLDKVLEQTDPDNMWDPDLPSNWSKEQGSRDAKLTVRFINKSENGATFEWVFLDTVGGVKQTETTYNVDDQPEYTYETADEWYYPYLHSISEEECIDSMKLEEGIFVEPSQLVIPNVFTPNGDERNDVWMFKHQSLKTCKVTVMDRTGKVVYKREIDNIYEWEGWNGNVKESTRRAPEGQYYFVVEATGYDNEEYKDPTIWETMDLFSGFGNQTSGGSSGGTQGGQGTENQPETLFTGWLYLYRH